MRVSNPLWKDELKSFGIRICDEQFEEIVIREARSYAPPRAKSFRIFSLGHWESYGEDYLRIRLEYFDTIKEGTMRL